MDYRSTRGSEKYVTASQAILEGIAPDGGLYVPVNFPTIQVEPDWWITASYQEMAQYILTLFLTDFTEDEIKDSITMAYDTLFDTPTIAPVRHHGQVNYLELFHGPTLAFKDMALTLLPHLLTLAAKKQGMDRELIILTATSGDTGKAAMAGFADVPGTKIVVFYPKEGVSPVQEQQMVTQSGHNTFVVGITGNFDDAQTRVKELFIDQAMNQELAHQEQQLSSANSINIGRLLPQVAYYAYAYGQLVKSGQLHLGEPMNVAVPTGNFGNILAAYYAKKIGVPIQQLVCASNQNHVLTDFFNQGTYNRQRDFFITTSPSMDILVSSNLERFLYHLTDEDTELVTQLMTSLESNGQYTLPVALQARFSDFYAGYADDTLVKKTIYETYIQDHYLIEPHTAVAKAVVKQYQDVTGDKTPTVIVSTASPFKFPQAILEAIGDYPTDLSISELVTEIGSLTNQDLPQGIQAMLTNPIRHHLVIHPDDMKDTILALIHQN
ncbi:threonine synthase [Vagococcus penaei]|uniref:Threonine synthase n=1 Tax=Vagococcus penaei TaxID=633807 RepID=A0A1Q2D7R0_9ENTE|nr:threonine synthase [Vagococcus penaei]AQP54372.1 threonine synthase [Vagococcus penaei]RSU06287.1 threonine synthase [Vagococcus penaei]